MGPSTNRWIKRIVAGPGDVISIRHGLVVCNGTTERGDRLLLEHCEWSPECELPTPVTVPEGTFFMLGDNPGQSQDSRHWGPIPADWIVGRIDTANQPTPELVAGAPESAVLSVNPVRAPDGMRMPDTPPVVARGQLHGGSWTLHAEYEPERADGGGLSVHVQIYNGRGDPTEGSGAAGLDLATDDAPVQFIIGRRGPGASFCYLGQAIKCASVVELGLSDGSMVNAELVDGGMPVRVWIAFTDITAVATAARAISDQGELGRDEIEEAWPTSGTICWLPDDD